MVRIVILMSTYNGEKYIVEQIESILAQKVDGFVDLYIRDDGSTDNTISIVGTYAERYKNVHIKKGENIGAKKSFMELVMDAPKADFYAFSDQDDIWDLDKIEAALKLIRDNRTEGNPILYHSSVKLCDANGNVYGTQGVYNNIGFLMGETRPIAGCTTVFDYNLMRLLKRHSPVSFPMHDAWIHKLCLAVGGTVVFDVHPHINYRQHEDNVVGGNKGLLFSIKRHLKYVSSLNKHEYKDMYCEILNNYSDVMPAKNIERCKMVCNYDTSVKNTIKLLNDKYFFRGRTWWSLEQRLLVLSRKY